MQSIHQDLSKSLSFLENKTLNYLFCNRALPTLYNFQPPNIHKTNKITEF